MVKGFADQPPVVILPIRDGRQLRLVFNPMLYDEAVDFAHATSALASGDLATRISNTVRPPLTPGWFRRLRWSFAPLRNTPVWWLFGAMALILAVSSGMGAHPARATEFAGRVAPYALVATDQGVAINLIVLGA